MSENQKPENSTDKDLLKRILDIENRQVAQETRVFAIVKNIFKFGIQQPEKEGFTNAVTALFTFILKRQWVVVITSSLAAIMSIITIIIALKSNSLLEDQNVKIDYQNNRVVQQNQLLEADRRSSLVFLFNNIMDALDKELKEPVSNIDLLVENKSIKGKISKQLSGRIISLSKRLMPYKIYDYSTDSLSVLVSPERGQLLINLLEANLDTVSLSHIYGKGDFSYAQLNDYTTESLYLKGINLSHASWKNSTIVNANFNSANLTKAKLQGTTFARVEFQGATLDSVNLMHGSILNCQCANLKLIGANLTNTALAGSDLRNASLVGAKLDSTRLLTSDLSGMLFYERTSDTIITNRTFMSHLDRLKIVGREEIKDEYELIKAVVKTYDTLNGKPLIRLQKKINLRTEKLPDILYYFTLRKKQKKYLEVNFYRKPFFN